jgi:hypothetical protein
MIGVATISTVLAAPVLRAQGIEAAAYGSVRANIYKTEVGAAPFLPPTTPYWNGPLTLNKQTLAYERGAHVFENASNLGLVALPAHKTDFSNRQLPLKEDCNQAHPLSEDQKRAIGLLHSKAILKDGMAVWHYNYDQQANDVVVLAPYPSAFSQAINIHALLFAYCKTLDSAHLELAIKAGDGMLTTVANGGTRNGWWFEEQPAPKGYMPYILNAHIYSLVVLYALSETSGLVRFRFAAEQGVKILDQLLMNFDTGSWTRYDLRPRSPLIYFEVHPRENKVIERIEIRAGDSVFSICNIGCTKILGSLRNGKNFSVAANLPSLRRFHAQESVSPTILVVATQPSLEPIADIYVGSVRPREKELTHVGAGGEIQLDFVHMGWSQLQEDYQRWHAFLMAQLWKKTQKAEHFVTALRWANYSATFVNQKAAGAPLLHRPAFSRTKDAAADQLIAKCLGRQSPLVILSSAKAKLEKCYPGATATLSGRIGFSLP